MSYTPPQTVVQPTQINVHAPRGRRASLGVRTAALGLVLVFVGGLFLAILVATRFSHYVLDERVNRYLFGFGVSFCGVGGLCLSVGMIASLLSLVLDAEQ